MLERKEIEIKNEIKNFLTAHVNFIGTPQEISEKVYELTDGLYNIFGKHSRALSTDFD